MPHSISELELHRSQLAVQPSRLGDLRPGSVTGNARRCGKPTCHCAEPDDPGHCHVPLCASPGKTISETLPTPASVGMAEREIAEFRNGGTPYRVATSTTSALALSGTQSRETRSPPPASSTGYSLDLPSSANSICSSVPCVIEAGCKTVIGDRLKQSGMFWTVNGSCLLALRCSNLNGRFEDYWESRRAADLHSYVVHQTRGVWTLPSWY